VLVPELKGGLGNQMFTIAATYAKSLKMNCLFGINYSLPHYAMQGQSPKNYKESLYSRLPETDYVPKMSYKEPGWSYSPLPDSTDMLVCGYLQSEKHFLAYKDDIKNIFCFSNQIKEKINQKINNFSKKIIGIHIRLGDYLKPDCRSIHLLCTVEYYKTALKQFDTNNYDVVIFTDDPDNCKKFEQELNGTILVNNTDVEDLYFLTQCDAVIMSNSSFSWWGAYLGKHKEKIFAPSRWFSPGGPINYQDIYLNNWDIIPI
jgi:hypothetical protein